MSTEFGVQAWDEFGNKIFDSNWSIQLYLGKYIHDKQGQKSISIPILDPYTWKILNSQRRWCVLMTNNGQWSNDYLYTKCTDGILRVWYPGHFNQTWNDPLGDESRYPMETGVVYYGVYS